MLRNAAAGLTSLLSGSRRPDDLGHSIEEIRELMLEALGTTPASAHLNLCRRIRYAQDTRVLWYLRGDLMAALSYSHGESAARDTMYELSQAFQGCLPASLGTRPSPLA